MEQLISAFEELVELERQNARRLERLLLAIEQDQRTWLDPDEVCRRLGIPVTKSGSNRRRLKWLRDHGFLTCFGNQNPFTYDSEEVKKVVDWVKAGKVVIPSRV